MHFQLGEIMSNEAIHWALKQTVGKAGAKFVLFVLADHASADGGSCFPRISHIAKVTEQDERTVRRHLDHLEKIGMINRYRFRQKSGHLSGYNYQLNLDEEHKTELEPPVDNLSTGQNDQRTKCPLPPDKMSALDNPQFNPQLKKQDFEILIFEKVGETDEIKDQVQACWDYWQAYPEKMPSGDIVAAFKGWMRNAKPRQGFSGKQNATGRNKSFKEDKGAGTGLNTMDRQRVKGYFETGFWLDQWGEKPDNPLCRINPAIIQEFQPERTNA